MKNANLRNLYNQVPHLTRDTIWVSSKITRKHHTQESQEASSFPAGDHKPARKQAGQYNNDKHNTQIAKRIHKSSALALSVKILLEGLNMPNGTNLTLANT